MRIESLSAYHIKLPFKLKFAHSRAKRSSTENVVVKVVLENGIEGWGECVPRDYVTGETPRTVFKAYEHLKDIGLFEEFSSFEHVLNFLARGLLLSVRTGKALSNAAWCAVELAFLDASCRRYGKTLAEVAALFLPEEMLNKEPAPVRYGVGISAGSLFRTSISALKYKLFGFEDAKVKVGKDIDKDCARLKWVRSILGKNVRIRVDANSGYTFDEALLAGKRFEKFAISAFEDPLKPEQRDMLKSLKEELSMPIVLDEPLCTLDDARRLGEECTGLVFSIRISKVGGFIKACEMARTAAINGSSFQLGCQVGETGILSAAGRLFAQTVRGIKYLEGSYDRYLLKDNIIAGDVSFGRGGRASPLVGFGLCVEVDESRIEKHLVGKREYK